MKKYTVMFNNGEYVSFDGKFDRNGKDSNGLRVWKIYSDKNGNKQMFNIASVSCILEDNIDVDNKKE